jgi:hypothetical protein
MATGSAYFILESPERPNKGSRSRLAETGGR